MYIYTYTNKYEKDELRNDNKYFYAEKIIIKARN